MGLGPDVLQRAANVAAPLSGRVIVLSVTDTAARFAIPTTFAGRMCVAMMDGSDADIVFGNSSVVCTYGQAASVSTEAITIHAQSGGHLKDGAYSQPFQMPTAEKATHFSVDCKGSGSGKLYITMG